MKKKWVYFLLSFILVWSLGGCANQGIEKEPFVVIKTKVNHESLFLLGHIFNSENIGAIIDYAKKIKVGNKDYLMVDNKGKDVIKDYVDQIPESDEEIKNFIMDLSKHKQVRFVQKKQYRVTNWKKEIDGVFKNKRSVDQVYRDSNGMLAPSPLNEFMVREKFMEEVSPLYENEEYKKI